MLPDYLLPAETHDPLPVIMTSLSHRWRNKDNKDIAMIPCTLYTALYTPPVEVPVPGPELEQALFVADGGCRVHQGAVGLGVEVLVDQIY